MPAPETSPTRTALGGPGGLSGQAAVNLRLATLAAQLAAFGVLSADSWFVHEHLATLGVNQDPNSSSSS